MGKVCWHNSSSVFFYNDDTSSLMSPSKRKRKNCRYDSKRKEIKEDDKYEWSGLA